MMHIEKLRWYLGAAILEWIKMFEDGHLWLSAFLLSAVCIT
jgi:hypothetical protein